MWNLFVLAFITVLIPVHCGTTGHVARYASSLTKKVCTYMIPSYRGIVFVNKCRNVHYFIGNNFLIFELTDRDFIVARRPNIQRKLFTRLG